MCEVFLLTLVRDSDVFLSNAFVCLILKSLKFISSLFINKWPQERVEFNRKQTYKLINDLHINRTSGFMQAIPEALHTHESFKIGFSINFSSNTRMLNNNCISRAIGYEMKDSK